MKAPECLSSASGAVMGREASAASRQPPSAAVPASRFPVGLPESWGVVPESFLVPPPPPPSYDGTQMPAPLSPYVKQVCPLEQLDESDAEQVTTVGKQLPVLASGAP